MQTLAADVRRAPFSLLFATTCFLVVAAAGVVAPASVTKLGPALFVVALVVATYEWLLQWRNLVVTIILVILLIPMRRYTLPASLPFQLEPYRVVVAFVALGWVTSLLVDRRVRAKKTGLERPIGLYVAVAILSMGVNPGRVSAVSSTLTKTLMFWTSYFFIVYFLPSVLKRIDLEVVSKALVGGGAFVSLGAIVESRTHYNVFDHLTTVMPFLRLGVLPLTTTDVTAAMRGGRPRAYASAQHPIALGAAVVMLIPLAIYLAKKTGNKRWGFAAVLLLLALFATVSRTGFLMLIVVLAIVYWLRHKEVKRYWPALIPAVAVIHFAVPGTFGTMINAFFPKGGLIAQQTNANVGSGRIATLKPVLRREFNPNPLLGEGFGTRISGDNGVPIASQPPILDDEWAGVLVQTGLLGTFAFGWIILRAVRMLARIAKSDEGPDGWLATALAAGIASFGVDMFTFDAFSFIQVTVLFFLFLSMTGLLHATRPLEAAPRLHEVGRRRIRLLRS